MAALGVPDEIIEIILLNLPIKSLFRFKSVSKSWNTMISDHRFIRTHYELSTAKSDNSLFVNDDEDGWFSFVRLEGRQLKAEERVLRPLGWRSDTWPRIYNTFLCIGDGLLLLHSDLSSFVLWNPFTRQQTIIPFPYYNSDDYSTLYGVCYDPINEDVKVVIGFKDFYTVYSSKNGSWAENKEFPFQIADQRFDGQLSVDGAIYWRCDNKVVYFDSKDDSFKILQTPENEKDDRWLDLKARKGQLYLCCYVKCGRNAKIWIKEKGGWSWKLLVNIDSLDIGSIGFRMSECSCRSHGRIRLSVVAPLTENEMIMHLGWGRYCIYNCFDKSKQEIKANTTLRKRLCPFLGSMFFPVRNASTKPSGRLR